eukprot:CAMPEP_0174249930 /NCGR_PEP_ID=MMETSP0439-20130205/255_1 /TAXON_ID=0 /ORGANISM="Stereomyxa ramosa, Strain Chinc5" /LENGTH=77 /DNA_ID=CAMNT_0015329875 /DNA_START=43 /DNA_END=276 /DNA_ORIENTATION=+
MLVKVKNLTGNIIEINLDASDTIQKVKEYVEEKAGIPPTQQRLIFGGKAMADQRTVESYKIEAGAVLHLVLALRGGN